MEICTNNKNIFMGSSLLASIQKEKNFLKPKKTTKHISLPTPQINILTQVTASCKKNIISTGNNNIGAIPQKSSLNRSARVDSMSLYAMLCVLWIITPTPVKKT